MPDIQCGKFMKPSLRAKQPVADRAEQAGVVVQDIARSSVTKLINRARSMRKQKGPAPTLRRRACIQCHRVITAATLKPLDTKYKAHLRRCRPAGRSA